MEYRTFTGTGATVSRVCLGTMTFGQQVEESEAIRITHAAIDAGVNFIDTADSYGQGESERILGKALKGRRDSVVLASKVGNFVGQDENRDSGLHRWHVVHGVEANLKRLGTDCLDICYLHTPDRRTPIEETMAAFDLLVRQGKVNYVGMSNYAAWQVCEALWACDVSQLTAPAVIQVPYNLIARSLDEECVAFCKHVGVGMAVYNPLAGGLLTGKHTRTNGPLEGTRFALNEMYRGRFWQDANFAALARLQAIAAEAGKSILELAFHWLLTQTHVDSIIIGVSRMEHLRDDLTAADGTLDEATLTACDAVWRDLRGGHFAYNR